MLAIDVGYGSEDEARAWWMDAGGAEDARDLLSSLFTGVISMAAMVFSATVVALTLAAGQYGPRLVRVFRSDRTTQVTLGTFVMTIVYLVLVLRMVRGDSTFEEVPHVAITFGTMLSLACVMVLLVFIQELACMAVADDIVERVGRELDTAVENLPRMSRESVQVHLNDRDSDRDSDRAEGTDFWEKAGRIVQRQEGYVQAIEYGSLVSWAQQHKAVLRLDFRAGDFVAAGDQRILVHPASVAAAAEADHICGFAVVGRERTPTQDIEFAIRHLVEVAVRALSPGINDPFTAIAVIDRLRGCLTRLAGRQLPVRILRDQTGQICLVRETTTFTSLTNAAFHQIRQAGARHPAVVIHLVDAIARIAEHASTTEHYEALARHVQMIAEAGLREAAEPGDRREIQRSLAQAERALTRTAAPELLNTLHARA
jgi:uncharacterized membrane protein